MRKGDYLTAILRSNKTVFSTEDIALLWHESSSTAARVRLSYFVKNGDLFRIRRGLYAKSEDFRVLELATRIYVPSYISFETVLAREGNDIPILRSNLRRFLSQEGCRDRWSNLFIQKNKLPHIDKFSWN